MLDRYLEEFSLYLLSEKGASFNTHQGYLGDLRDFFSFSSSLTKETATSWFCHLRKKGYEDSSIKRKGISLRVFCSFLAREKIIEKNPIEALSSPKIWQKIPTILTQDEVNRLIATPPKEEVLGARDRAIFELLYSSGLRASELCGLLLTDLHDGFVKVQGKGNKERIVPVGKPAQEAISHWLAHCRPDGKEEKRPYLFVSLRGKKMSRFDLYRRLVYWAKVAGISKKISPHDLRHTFATDLLRGGADLRVIQEMLGHSSIASTDRYTQVDRSHLEQAFARCHPRP